MAWIEAHQGLANHKKTIRLRKLLNIKKTEAIGTLFLLWWWAMDNAPDGDLSELDAQDIAEIVEYKSKNPQIVLDALIESGFIDSNKHIHDWNEYIGRLIESREKEKEYKKRQYDLYSDARLIKSVKSRDGDICQYCGIEVNWKDRKGALGGTYDHIDPKGKNVIGNITVACRSCNSKKGGRTPAEAGMKFIDSSIFNVDTSRFNAENQQINVDNNADKQQINGKNNLQLPYSTIPNRTVPISTITSVNIDIHSESENSENGGSCEQALKAISDFYTKSTGKLLPSAMIADVQQFLKAGAASDLIEYAIGVSLGKNNVASYFRGVMQNKIARGIKTYQQLMDDEKSGSSAVIKEKPDLTDPNRYKGQSMDNV